MQKILVEFCRNNLASGTEETRKMLAKDRELDIDIMEYGCLSHCTLCERAPFALVEGTVVSATTPAELYVSIKEQIAKEQEKRDQLDDIFKYL